MSKLSLSFNKTAALVLICALGYAADALRAQTVTTIATFNGANGTDPLDPLVQAADGSFYGTTAGGAYGGKLHPGTVFKVTPGGTLATLASLGRWFSTAGLVEGSDGNFYGTTKYGGAHDGGTIFTVSPAGKLSVLYSGCPPNDPSCTGNGNPIAGLIQGLDGDLYGTFIAGTTGFGAVYKINPQGTLTTLHVFSGTDGATPWSGVIQASDGNYYGTTVYGGAGPCDGGVPGCGTVFRMTPAGALTTFYSFCTQPNCTDGSYPYAGLVQGSDGNLYGVTSQGGGANCTGGCGTAYRIALDGSYTLLNTFGVMGANNPQSALVQATDGNFYGTGANGIFQMTPAGGVTVLYQFTGNGAVASLVQATDGNLYGTTEFAGVHSHPPPTNAGTVYRLSLGLGPFVKTQPTAGKVGARVTILGTSLGGASSVTFNGTPATSFAVNSTDSAISTRVPVGATTGLVRVTLPGGVILSSNVPFRVLP